MRYRYLPILLLVSILVIVLYSGLGIASWKNDSLQVTAEEARRGRFSFIFDLRTQTEREEGGFYPNSIPISLTTLKEEVPFLLGHKSSDPRPLLVYSNAHDGRAKLAAEALYDMGLIGARYLSGSYLQMMPPGIQS